MIKKYNLKYSLASDEKDACEKLNIWVEKSMYGKKYFGIDRSTFIIDKNGKILITVPAFQGLFTHKDIVLNHYRRYNTSRIKKVFKNFIILKLSYFNFFLFLPLSLSLLILKTLKV